jgi:hypothetical protein
MSVDEPHSRATASLHPCTGTVNAGSRSRYSQTAAMRRVVIPAAEFDRRETRSRRRRPHFRPARHDRPRRATGEPSADRLQCPPSHDLCGTRQAPCHSAQLAASSGQKPERPAAAERGCSSVARALVMAVPLLSSCGFGPRMPDRVEGGFVSPSLSPDDPGRETKPHSGIPEPRFKRLSAGLSGRTRASRG